ncbi:C-5 sterol desaturase, partial [Klebsiella pneumoniae]
MDAVAGFFSALPEEMRDPVLFAIPCFLLLLILEWTAARKLESIETAATGQPRPASGAYLTRDSVASISMGLVSIATTAGWKSLALLGYAAIYAYLAPWQLSAHRWYTWVIAIVGVDLLYYSYHRIAHRVRLIWATHQAHHSSEYFNFATALRQKWNNSGEILMWVPLPLMGLPPWMVFCSWSLNLIYQFWVHT